MQPWTPLLVGDDAARASARIASIAATARRAIPGAASLASGTSGEALFFAYLGDAEHTDVLLEASLRAAASGTLTPSLYGGFAGVGFMAEQIAGDENDDLLAPIDAAVRAAVPGGVRPFDFDLITGVVGLGVYAVERLPRPAAVDTLHAIVQQLDAWAERPSPGRVTWHTRPELLPPHQREEAPYGYYNLGVAHGVPGVIALLGEIVAADVAPRARPLLDEAVAWLLEQRLPATEPGAFDSCIHEGRTPAATRSAWCYGDPGIAAALLVAARGAGEPTWERIAIDLARTAARRPVDDTGVIDAAICHGAAGLAHLFNRIHQTTADPELADAARAWFRRALDMPVDGDGFLTGDAGIGLTLLSALDTREPGWDRVLLTAIPA